jgi:HAE1 family hydrophobic/amphiphilic exporter-1
MKLVEVSTRRRVTLSMIYLIVIGFAIFSFSQLKVDLLPDLNFPVIGIITQYSGVGPEDVENLIARPLEEGVSVTKNVKRITSQISEGVCLTLLEFEWGSDIDQAEADVRKRIDLVRDLLPDDASQPVTFAFDPSMMPVMFLLLNSSTHGPAELRRISEDQVEPLLERVEGVAGAETQGGLERRINIRLNPTLLASHNISPTDVVNAIRIQSGLFPAGTIDTRTTNFNLRIMSEYQSLEQLRNVRISYEKGIPLLLSEVAVVEDGFKEVKGDVRANYNQSVYLRLFKRSDANTVQACQNAREAIADVIQQLPEGVQLKIVYDQSDFIMRSISNLGTTALLAFLLAFLVIYFFLRNIRGSIIMGLAIPVSVFATFAVMMLTDLTLNIISMAGLALAIGMLVDNSIVVLENIYRLRESGYVPLDAANQGASEVGMAITASTLTTIGVFLPVLFVPGIAGELFSDMVVTITFSLFTSLAIALTLVPMLSSRILRIQKLASGSLLSSLNTGIENFLNRFTAGYGRMLHWSLYHKKTVLLSTTVIFILSLFLTPFLGGEFMPRNDQGFIAITIKRELGTPLEQTRLTVLDLEKVIREKVPETTDIFAVFGSAEGIFALVGGSGSESINFRVRLTPMEDRKRSQFEIEDTLRAALDRMPGVTYQFMQGGMFSSERAIEVKIFGFDLVQGKQIAEEIKSRMDRIKGIVDTDINVKDGGQELRVIPDRQRLNDLKLATFQVADIISTSIQGKVAARFRDQGDEYDIYVQLDKPYRKQKESLLNLQIPTITGKMIPLSQVATIEQGNAPTTIYRENQERYVSIGCDLSDLDLSTAVSEIRDIIGEVGIPSNFQVQIGGTAEDQQESFFYLTIAFAAAIILVYMIMAAQFESLIDPFIIMFTVPLSTIGVFILLFITGTTLSVMALVGLVMLTGIVVNNGIVLVDYINQRVRAGVEMYEAVEEGGRVRLRPVLMTALTTILGMVPLAFELSSGSESWSPLARAVIGGLTTSTFLTLLVIPIIYILFNRFAVRIKQKINRYM